MMATTITDKRVIITGGANGLGKGFADQLLRKSAKMIVILDVDIESGTKTAENFNRQYGTNRVIFLHTDVTNTDQFQKSFEEAVDRLGGLDIMINNAGMFGGHRWNLMVDTNIKGLIQGTLMAISAMGKHKGGKGGTIINVASILGVIAGQYVPIYCATKHAVTGFSRSIAMNFERTGVSVKTLCPSAVDTAMTDFKQHYFLELVDQEKAVQWARDWPLQKVEVLAKIVDQLIEEAPNGAVWVNRFETSTLSMDFPPITQWGTPV